VHRPLKQSLFAVQIESLFAQEMPSLEARPWAGLSIAQQRGLLERSVHDEVDLILLGQLLIKFSFFPGRRDKDNLGGVVDVAEFDNPANAVDVVELLADDDGSGGRT